MDFATHGGKQHPVHEKQKLSISQHLQNESDGKLLDKQLHHKKVNELKNKKRSDGMNFAHGGRMYKVDLDESMGTISVGERYQERL